jgi:hypothetical protein
VSSGGEIQRAVNDKIAVRYHLLDVANNQSANGDYSTRAIAASFCVADTHDPNRYRAFHAACSQRISSRRNTRRPIVPMRSWRTWRRHCELLRV